MNELDRLFQRVVSAARTAKPESLSAPVEVADLVDLVPYKDVRGDIGVETNDDYHHALTRLLSGEGGYVFGDDLMQDDLKAELSSATPNLAAYRSYLNTRVTLSMEKTKSAIEALGLPALPAETKARAPTPRSTMATRAPAAPSALISLEGTVEKRASRPGCRHCGGALPEGREVRYCPHCGLNLLTRRCAACSAELEAGWKFCVSCGRATTA